jgi:hypothetical protein
MKQCFFHTYVSTDASYILLPQNLYTRDFTSEYIAYSPKIFINSILIQNKQILFVGVLITNNNTQGLTSSWVGVSFSPSHVYHDMVMILFEQTS